MAAELFEILHGVILLQRYGNAMSKTVAVILAVVRAIPAGEVRGYGEVARLAGLPRGARQVARVLAQNDDPALPWHRVLRSDGRVAMPEGSAGFEEQVRRLQAEGVVLKGGRVAASVRKAAPLDLDALLWAPPPKIQRVKPR